MLLLECRTHSRTALHLAASEGNLHLVKVLLANGANAFAVDRWGAHPLADATREGHAQIATLLRSGMDGRAGSVEGVAEYAHLDEVRQWLVQHAGMREEGKGLHALLETLDAEGVDTVELLRDCWAELQPLLKLGPAARVAKALGAAVRSAG